MSNVYTTLQILKEYNDQLELETTNVIKQKILELQSIALQNDDFESIEILMQLRSDLDCM